MHDNHAAVDLVEDFVLINALVLGLASCRVVGNRFRETLRVARKQRGAIAFPPTFLSAVTFGLLNATELNQGDYCFLALGGKKPRILTSVIEQQITAVLDTNRHTLPDGFCSVFRNISTQSGTA